MRGYPLIEHLGHIVNGEIIWAPAIDGMSVLSPRGGRPDAQSDKMTVSPRLKTAFRVSRALGHSYFGADHLLVVLAAVSDSLAGTLLNTHGVTPKALRQKVVNVAGKGAEDGLVYTRTVPPNLAEYLVEVGYRPEFGARELKRKIRQKEEIRVAKEILGHTSKSEGSVEIDYDKHNGDAKLNHALSSSNAPRDKSADGHAVKADADIPRPASPPAQPKGVGSAAHRSPARTPNNLNGLIYISASLAFSIF